MEKIAIYGKGGIGKSTISSCLSVAFGVSKKKTIQIGCDPKHDSTLRICGKHIPTVMDIVSNKDVSNIKSSDILFSGFAGVHCIETGGPKAGVGCAGRGITKMFEILDEIKLLDDENYDVALFDVLGDVVCGGFAAPMRAGIGDKIIIVVSEEIMSLYAANNIMYAINTYKYNDIYLAGLIINLRNNKSDISHIIKFARLTNSQIIDIVPRNKLIAEAEKKNKTVLEAYPDSKISQRIKDITFKISNIKREKSKLPTPMEEMDFNKLFEN